METTVKITDLAYGGSGVGRSSGKVVFVPFTAPGDVARVEVTTDKKTYSEGRLIELLTPSPLRAVPPCPYFTECGGCALQHINYPAQVELKQRILAETLKRIGKITPESFEPPLPSERAYGYRTRARFHVDAGQLGFFAAGTNRVVDIAACPILDHRLNNIYGRIREALFRAMVSVSEKISPLYALELALSPSDGSVTALFYVSQDPGVPWEKMLAGVDGLKGFEVRLDARRRWGGRVVFTSGDTSISYNLGHLRIKASAGVFTQANAACNLALVERVVNYSGLKGPEVVVDLFSGVGNFTLPLATRVLKAIGVESSPEAVTSALGNAEANSLGGVDFFEDCALTWLKRNSKALDEGPGYVVILDPPRGGDIGVAKILARSSPVRIVYVSCSPPTLARDLSLLAEKGTKPVRAVLVDMFPQTYHMECVVELSR